MFRDSIALFKEYPLFGVGAGQWSTAYRAVIDPVLATFTVAYLHSDPFQLLVELGLVGGAICLYFFGLLTYKIFAAMRQVKGNSFRSCWGLFIGILALLSSSCLDFPFRIPAVTVQCAVGLALLVYQLEQAKSETRMRN